MKKYKCSEKKRKYQREYVKKRRKTDKEFREKDRLKSNEYTREHTELYRNKMRKRLKIPKSRWRK